MNLKIIACKIIQRELASLAWCCPNTLDITMIRQSYHCTPLLLHDLLQEEIDRVESDHDPHTNDLETFDAILLGYGLCSNALMGLHSSRYPLVIPRAHDCSTLFMGSRELYQKYFNTYKGAYFYNQSWMELGKGMDDQYMTRKYNEYMEKFEDEDTVEYLMQMERDMLANYRYAAYITWPDFSDDDCRKQVKELADEKSWEYVEICGSNRLLKKMLDGQWDSEDFLIVPPGWKTAADNDNIICAIPVK